MSLQRNVANKQQHRWLTTDQRRWSEPFSQFSIHLSAWNYVADPWKEPIQPIVHHCMSVSTLSERANDILQSWDRFTAKHGQVHKAYCILLSVPGPRVCQPLSCYATIIGWTALAGLNTGQERKKKNKKRIRFIIRMDVHYEIPEHHIWDNDKWKPRKRLINTICRIYTIDLVDRERYPFLLSSLINSY